MLILLDIIYFLQSLPSNNSETWEIIKYYLFIVLNA